MEPTLTRQTPAQHIVWLDVVRLVAMFTVCLLYTSSLNGLPSQMVQGYLVYGKQTHETDLAYPSLMLAQTELLGDVVATDYGYDWWWRFNANNGMNDTGCLLYTSRCV